MLKRNLHKALALLASVVILCTVLPLGALFSAGAEGENLVVNGDFEDGKNNWAFNSGTAEIVADAHDGSAALLLTNPGQWAEGAIQTVSVEANAEYKIEWYSKRVSGTGTFNLYVMNTADWSNLMAVSGQNWMSETSGNWVRNEYVVNTNSATSVLLKFSTQNNNPGSILLDDITMTKVSGGNTPDQPDDPAANMLVNGDFETGDISGWTNLWDSNTISIVEGHDSANAMNVISGQWKIVRQKVAVEPNTDYIVRAWAKDVNDMSLLIKDGNDTANMTQTNFANGDTWKETTLEFNSGDNSEVLICLMGNAAESKGTFDDIVMVKKGGSTPDAPTSGLTNGDFETGDLTGWSPWQQTAVSADAAHSDAYGANLKGDGGWGGLLDQTFTVTEGKDYILTFWYKANASGANFVVKANNEPVASTWCNATAWTQVTLEFTAPAADLLLNICGGGTGVAEDLYVDDFVLTEKPGSEPEPTVSEFQNGDFETGDLTGWSPWQETAVSADAAHSGSYGANLKGNGGWGGLLDQNFTVTMGKNYILTFWYKANASGANFVIKAYGEPVTSTWCNATAWTQVTLEFNAPAADLLLNICGGGTSVAEDLYVDDFVLTEKSAAPTGLVNGDFEDGTNGWTIGGNTALSSDDVHGGSNALLLSHDNAWGEAAYQVVALEQNTDYTLTWYSKRVSGEGSYMVSLMNEANFDQKVTTVEGQNWFKQTSTEWTKHTYTFNTGAFTEIRFKFCPESVGAGSFLIDDITLIKASDEPVDPTGNLVKNGDFSLGQEGWNWGGNTTVDNNNGYTAVPAALLDHNSAFGEALTQMVKMEKNTDYVIIFYTKRVSGHGSWDLFLMDGDTITDSSPFNIPTNGNRWFNQTVDSGWVKTRLEFNSGEITKAFLKFGPEAENSGVFLLDDIGMYKKGNEPVEPVDPVIPVSGMALTSYGVVNNRPISADKNLLQNGNFEATGGQWDVDTFRTEQVSVVADSTTMFGSKSLYFNTSALTEAEAVQTVFWMELQPDTSYVFSTWIKGALLADDNRGRGTVGVVDANGQFLANRDILFLDGTRQLVPTSWDDQWHLRSVEFNTGSNTTIGIALAGWGSKMWIDDMALFKVGDGTKYMSENMGGGVKLSYDIDHIGCDDEDSLIPDPNMKKADESKFWAGSYGWRNNFMSFVDNKYEYGASMKYTSTGDAAATYIIKWVDVEPHTQYTFAVDIKILEDGFGRIGLLDNKKLNKVEFFSVSFDSYDYDDYDNTGWRTVATSFNTDVYDKIGIAFVDDGGEVLIDNMRFFKNSDGKNVVDYYIEPPASDDYDYSEEYEDEPIENEDPQEENQETVKKKKKKVTPAPAGVDPMVWVWIGVGSAVVLAGAAVTIILLVNKRKKNAAAAAASATAEVVDEPPTPDVSAE